MVEKSSNIQQKAKRNIRLKKTIRYIDTVERLKAYQGLFTRLRAYDENGEKTIPNKNKLKRLCLVKKHKLENSKMMHYLMFSSLSYRLIDFDILKKELNNPYWLSDIDASNQTPLSVFTPIYKKVYQNIDNQDVYPGFLKKSFALFYNLIKHKPLKVGNKRYACFMFDWYLNLTIGSLVLQDDIFDNLFYLAIYAEEHSEKETLELCNYAFS